MSSFDIEQLCIYFVTLYKYSIALFHYMLIDYHKATFFCTNLLQFQDFCYTE